MTQTWTWERYLKLLEDLGETLEKLAAVERKKTEAVCRNDLLTVDDCMNQEQVFSLSLRGFDQKREQALKALGLSGVPLNGLEARCPDALRLETKRVTENLRQKYQIVQTASEVARNTLECNLHLIERELAGRAGEPVPVMPKDSGLETMPTKKTDFRA